MGIRVDSSEMAFFRTAVSAGLAAVLAAACGTAAPADPPPWAHGHGHRPPVQASGAARSHGVVTGTIIGVDYGSASIVVGTSRGVVAVAVTPSTSIFRGSGFASFSDLARGARVSVDVSEIDGRLIAQIIRIR